MWWDAEKSTYVLATQTDTGGASMASYYGDKSTERAANSSNGSNSHAADATEDNSKDNEGKKGEQKQDKVKVAKKIVKDMERWAKQLNQKKDNAFQAAPMEDPTPVAPSTSRQQPLQRMANGYADVGFTIMENRESRLKPGLEITASKSLNKLLPYGSDSDNDADPPHSSGGGGGFSEKDLIDFTKLTCLLCKRAFQSLDILNKHIKMSNLHKENLQKLNLNNQSDDSSGNSLALSYRDRAKERRLKYGEVDPPPPNRSRERFEKELRKQSAQLQKQASSNLANVPIDQSNVGNRLLQKMGWSEGQGLGKSNQGRLNIIEVSSCYHFRLKFLGDYTFNFVLFS